MTITWENNPRGREGYHRPIAGRYEVEQPTLGLTNSPSQSTTIDQYDPAILARLKGTRGVGVYAGGAMLGGAGTQGSYWQLEGTLHWKNPHGSAYRLCAHV